MCSYIQNWYHSPKNSKVKLKNFSSVTLAEAFNQLGIERLQEWPLTVHPIQTSEFFQERLRRLKRFFDLRSYEGSKKWLIDAICEEALEPTHHLKIWKGAALKSDRTTSNVDSTTWQSLRVHEGMGRETRGCGARVSVPNVRSLPSRVDCDCRK